jgi:DDE superfamily endonuclease
MQGKRHKTLTDRARQAILQTKRWLGDRRVVIVADSSFAALELIAAIRRHVCLITRLRLDASLFEPAPERRPGQRGRPRLKGKRLPKLSAVLTDPNTVWTSVTMAEWYGGQRCMLEYVSGVAVWYTSGMPPARIRWVLVRDPSGERDAQAFLCTDLVSNRRRSLAASCSAGGSRPPSKRSASTSASRPNANGPTWRSCAPPRHCSDYTRLLPSGRMD